MKVGIRRWLDPDTVEVQSKGKISIYRKRWATSYLSLRHYSLSSHFAPNRVEEKIDVEKPKKLAALTEKARKGELDYSKLSEADNELIRFHHLQEVKPEKGRRRIQRSLSGWASVSGLWPGHKITACSFDGKELDQTYGRAWVSLGSTEATDKTIGSVLVSDRSQRDVDPEDPDSEDYFCLVFESLIGADIMDVIANEIRAVAEPPVVYVTFKALLLVDDSETMYPSDFSFERETNVYGAVTGIRVTTTKK